jgi:hypothetical protein
MAIAALLLFSVTPVVAGVSNQGDSAAAWPAAWNLLRHTTGTQISDANSDQTPNTLDIT